MGVSLTVGGIVSVHRDKLDALGESRTASDYDRIDALTGTRVEATSRIATSDYIWKE